jgi:hypothetical protein
MSEDTDKELMMAVLRQIDGTIDYRVLANDLGLEKPKNAWQRWSRFKTKNFAAGAKTSPATPKAKKAQIIQPAKVLTSNGKKGPATKKRKRASDDDEDEDDELDINLDLKNELEELEGDGTLQGKPFRRLPARKTRRVIAFKEESSEDDNSGHGSDSGEMEDDGLDTEDEKHEA